MTIASEISRLQEAKSCIKASIEGKGVTVGQNLKLDQYPACIDAIKGPDYSGGTMAYGLKATRMLNGTRSSGLGVLYDEIDDDGVMVSLLYNDGWLVSSNCDVRGMDVLIKCPGCNPSWSSLGVHNVGDSRSTSGLRIYKNDNNPDCFLVKRIYCCVGYMSSGNCWSDTCYYDTIGMDLSTRSIRCIGSGTWCSTGACCGGKNCDNNPPGEGYTYIGTSASTIYNCRQKPKGVLCTTLESQEDGSYIGAVVFR